MRRRRRYTTQTIRKKNNRTTKTLHSPAQATNGKGKRWFWFFLVIIAASAAGYYLYTMEWPSVAEKPVKQIQQNPVKEEKVVEQPVESEKIPDPPVVAIAERKVQVEILNGCGVSGVARSFEEYLKKSGFDVVNTDNYIVKGKVKWDVANSMVLDMVGKPEQAHAVARALGIPETNVISEDRPEALWDVRVVIGRDLEKLNGYSAN